MHGRKETVRTEEGVPWHALFCKYFGRRYDYQYGSHDYKIMTDTTKSASAVRERHCDPNHEIAVKLAGDGWQRGRISIGCLLKLDLREFIHEGVMISNYSRHRDLIHYGNSDHFEEIAAAHGVSNFWCSGRTCDYDPSEARSATQKKATTSFNASPGKSCLMVIEFRWGYPFVTVPSCRWFFTSQGTSWAKSPLRNNCR